ncbi:hypothetical protein [Halobaculum limi]|uniref:hypothetical protein n=1 Tax=Halobaculum limi TaxID=3031916 RepID=UPI00240685C1|nr:hypothetical protein [Halobaculum sp. YSMS11]
MLISGSTGDNSGDAYEITGTVEEARVSGVSSGFEIAVDGNPVDVETPTGDDSSDGESETSDSTTGLVGDDSVLEILATSESQIAYEIVVEGSASKSETNSVAADSSDEVETDGELTVITGTTGVNSGNAFEITGTIRSIEIEGTEAKVVFDDEEVTDQVM